MTQPAVIRSVAAAANGFADAAPGHRFNLYFPIWRDDWNPDNNRKKEAIKNCTRIPPPVMALLDGLRTRQETFFASFPAGLRLAAVSSAPFATGLGNEHPVENGFAFLSPYGLPYLAGSGVKGVLRRAAEELALFREDFATGNTPAPTLLDVWWLFGFEGAAGAWWPLSEREERELSDEAKAGRVRLRGCFQNHLKELAVRPDLPAFIRRVIRPGQVRDRYLDDPSKFLDSLDNCRSELHSRGALTCWDVFPQPPSDALTVEIMTPHYSDYYQKGGTPNDAGLPTPIPFLAIPPNSQFDFYVVCAAQDLPEALRPAWSHLLESIFAHAFDWLGFGAKTAVGYGAMRENPAARNKRERQRDEDQAKARRANLSPEDLAWEDHQQVVETFRQQFETAKKSRYNPGTFNQPRYDFMNTALTWKDTRSRQAAGELLKATMTKAWGTPGNTDSKRRIVEAVDKLCSKCP
ncbi:MAG: type III-B CRISPR module RAMP protein Cmr6 [Chromatiaceae bacterium]|nr:type III-B CRISPR module RAMP protein Cmr6 [Candidatus Thioaporhodococcus sediminis]